MKKKTIVRIIILFLCFIAVAKAVLFLGEQKRKREEWARQGLLAIAYRRQNGALPRVSGHPIDEEYYVSYDAINEARLYVYLAAYNEDIQSNEEEGQELTLEDFKNYLSSEYNADGSLRIQEGYENIRTYVDWYWKDDGAEDIKEYWRELTNIAMDYNVQSPQLVLTDPEEMNLSQLQELINKKNDPSYEINPEVMKGKE